MFQQKFVLFDFTLISLVLWYSVPSLKKNDHGQNFLHTSDLCLTLRLVCRNSRFPVSSEVKRISWLFMDVGIAESLISFGREYGCLGASQCQTPFFILNNNLVDHLTQKRPHSFVLRFDHVMFLFSHFPST